MIKTDKYKVLLVDDEAEVIDVIKSRINWEELGYEVIGSAQNGVRAFELAESFLPDVVITDIKMPYMDGLELSKKLKDEYPNIRIIIFTGFDEFEYAKEAIHLEIEEYMLKPVNKEELSKLLIELKHNLDQEKAEKLNVQKLEKYYMESLPLLQINFFVSLIEGRIRQADLSRYMSDYRINLNSTYYCSVVLHTSENSSSENMSPLLLAMSVQHEAVERIQSEWKGECFTYLGNTVFIIELDSEEAIIKLTDDCDKFCRWADRALSAVVTAGIGRPCNNLINVNSSYDGAREAVSHRVIYGTGRAIYIGEISPKEHEFTNATDNAEIHDLFKAISIGVDEAISKAVNSEMQYIKNKACTLNQHNLITMEMVGAFYRFCSNNSIDFNEFCDNLKDPYRDVPQMDINRLSDWVLEVSLKISRSLKSVRNKSNRNLIIEAQNIVRNRYQDPELSLDYVCSALNVSNSYFSSIFKKEVGKSFVTYLTDYRMEKAIHLIVETNEKSYEIAEHVGYLDANYFSYVFKKSVGMSPSKYRTLNQAK